MTSKMGWRHLGKQGNRETSPAFRTLELLLRYFSFSKSEFLELHSGFRLTHFPIVNTVLDSVFLVEMIVLRVEKKNYFVSYLEDII